MSMQQTHTTIVMRSYELLKHAIPVLNRLPKSQKFTLGDRIQQMLTEVLEKLIEASYAPPAQKKEILPQANILLEKLRFFFRLAHELGYLSMAQYKEMTLRTDEIGRMAGGWLKSLR